MNFLYIIDLVVLFYVTYSTEQRISRAFPESALGLPEKFRLSEMRLCMMLRPLDDLIGTLPRQAFVPLIELLAVDKYKTTQAPIRNFTETGKLPDRLASNAQGFSRLLRRICFTGAHTLQPTPA